MTQDRFNPNNWSVGSKLTAFTFGLVGLIIAALVLTISVTTSAMLEQRAVHSVQNELHSVVDMVDLFNRTAKREAETFGKLFAAAFDGQFTLDTANKVAVGERQVPVLANGGRQVNLDFTHADRFARQTGGNATVFVASGDDFVRISTSVKNEDGERAVGSTLDHASPAYAALRDGKSYTGLLTLFGKQLMTNYLPLQDGSGRVVGALYVGVDISQDLADLKQKIKAIKVGETGYFYVLNAAAGKGYGDLLVHPAKEGANLLSAKAADGREFIREILSSRDGVITYDWMNPGETAPRVKVVAYAHFPEWQWVVAGGTYRDEITKEASALRIRYIGLGLAALAVFAALLYIVVRKTVTIPLGRARDAAVRIAEGDLTVRIPTGRQDEIGRLAESMNGISAKLSALVGQVRDGAEQIASASQQIASGNQDLCVRTERQAANLATTASSMDQLTGTVRQNADNANRANTLAASASGVAQKGGEMVAQVINTMDSIDQSSRKINDIIGMIDAIAFQTNILALNAAVEAARAGEHGRGFAVVATEVRNLAQRSAASAKEIRDLIAASVDQVAAGSKLVKDAGQTMDEVLASVGRVTDIMAEISAASVEQRGGIEDVNRSIGEMDAATQQNAALVEEASAAAQSMHELAVNLARGVRLFKIAQLGHDKRPAIAQD